MTFENLPPDWPTIPLTDADHIANVLDLFVSTRDRQVGSLLILICDQDRRPVQPCIMGDINRGWPEAARASLEGLAASIAERVPGATVLTAIGRTGRPSVTPTDRRWADTVRSAFLAHLEVIGAYVITMEGTAAIPPRADQAA